MRVILDGKSFSARLELQRRQSRSENKRVLIVDESVALLPEDAAATGCALAETTTEERKALIRAGFNRLVGSD